MSDDPNKTQLNKPDKKRKSFVLALTLAFAPSFMLLGVLTFTGHTNHPAIILAVLCCASAACCIASASLLFQHNIWWATLAALVFFLLNLVISFFLGCGAMLNS
ncbi:MAG TPA: hypothetical protein VIK35_10330 [Verrucomicrobiae bacterium]